ncbi:MAG: class IV adenylate cyclase [Desulfobacterales bacterium]|nr:MAG: class IV adenylate cyclase [Desulfobacterales bacterium]
MEPLEIEVKFHLPDVTVTRNRILELGALAGGRVFETNIRFEDHEHSLIHHKALLRLRRDRKATLTYKSEPPIKDDEVKILKELEVEVSDFATTRQILESLGYHQEQVYEKWRETFTLDRTRFSIDNMPFGDFLEIEGAKADIRDMADQLGMPWERRILLNYLELFDHLRTKLNLSFTDVTFRNFERIRFNPADWLNRYEAGCL